MSKTETLLEDALRLPEKDRATIAFRLLESLDEDPADDVESAWASEVGDRVQALRSGKATTRPAVDVFRSIRQHVQGRS